MSRHCLVFDLFVFFAGLQSVEPPPVSDVLSVPCISPCSESRAAGTSLSLGAALGWVCTLSQASIFNPAGPALIFLVCTRSPVPCSFPAVNSLHRSVLRPLLFGCLCIWVKAASRASAALETCSVVWSSSPNFSLRLLQGEAGVVFGSLDQKTRGFLVQIVLPR
jgi:hypothetical protein